MMKGTVSSAGGPLSDTAKMKEPKQSIQWFGHNYGAPVYECPEIATPVGAPCILCEAVISTGDDGFVDVGGNPFHRLCLFKNVGITPTTGMSLGDCLMSSSHLTATDDAGHCIYCGRDF